MEEFCEQPFARSSIENYIVNVCGASQVSLLPTNHLWPRSG